jgi:hypothetical protein
MKKTVCLTPLLVSALVFLLPAFAFAQAKLSISGNLPGVPANPTDPGAWINGFYTLALMLGGVLAFGAVVYGGVLYSASAGNPSKQSEGKEWIWAALTGLLLLAGAWLVLNTINPTLTNVSFPTLSGLPAVGGTIGNGNPVGAGGGGVVGAGSLGTGITGATAGLQAVTANALSDLELACTLKTGSTCSVSVTSGVGGAHGTGSCDHANGCKADIAPNNAISAYILSLPRANPQTRGDGAPLYQAPDGAIYADERVRPPNGGTDWTGSHWDMSAHQ